ncbi:MAG: gamma carbonic anhydrase family protein [Rhodothalassiaceae bacterium]
MTGTFHGGGEILPFMGKMPRIAENAFIAPGARVIGDVEIGPMASVWFNCVLRGDVNSIRVGARSNIQDGSIVHVSRRTHPTHIGADVLIGHMATIHGCTLMDRSFVGLGAVVMDGAVIEEEGMLAAGALLSPGKTVRSGELWVGRPARLVRTLAPEERAHFLEGASGYAELAAIYLDEARARRTDRV